jgi:hypothetical protein
MAFEEGNKLEDRLANYEINHQGNEIVSSDIGDYGISSDEVIL